MGHEPKPFRQQVLEHEVYFFFCGALRNFRDNVPLIIAEPSGTEEQPRSQVVRLLDDQAERQIPDGQLSGVIRSRATRKIEARSKRKMDRWIGCFDRRDLKSRCPLRCLVRGICGSLRHPQVAYRLKARSHNRALIRQVATSLR